MHFKVLGLLTAACAVVAQRPMNTSICDYYTTALLKDNTAENQYKVLTLVVNTAVVGNYTMPNKNVVPGILNPKANFNGTAVNLLPYFSGMLDSTNEGGSSGVSTSFLDGGGAASLMKSKPANDTTSNQYKLFTHLYSFFGAILQCSQYGQMGFPKYGGDKSMYQVHKFMNLKPAEVGYFIEQVGLSATSFGVTQEDASTAGLALGKLFGYRCSPPTTVVPELGPQLQSICDDSSCPLDPKAMCNLEDNNGKATEPKTASSSMSSTMTSTATATTGTMTASKAGNAAATAGVAPLALVGPGLLALLL